MSDQIKQRFDWPLDRRIITGVSGTGKTTLFERMLRERARWKFVFDCKEGGFWRKFKKRPCFDVDDLVQAAEDGEFVVFDPCRDWPGRIPEAFSFFCDFVLALSTRFAGRKILAVEELQKCIPKKQHAADLLVLMDTARTFQVDFIANGAGLNRINCDVRNQLNKVFTFRQSDENALKFLKSHGFDENKVLTLPRGKYLWKNLDTGEAGEGGSAF